MKTKLLLPICFLLMFSTLSAQNIFIVDKTNGTHRDRFYEGKNIKIKTVDGRKIIGKINYIGDSSLFINEKEFQIPEIAAVIKTRKFFAYTSYVGIACAAAFLPANMISNATNHRRIVNTDTYIIAAGAFGTYGICTLFKEKKLKIGARYKASIVNF